MIAIRISSEHSPSRSSDFRKRVDSNGILQPGRKFHVEMIVVNSIVIDRIRSPPSKDWKAAINLFDSQIHRCLQPETQYVRCRRRCGLFAVVPVINGLEEIVLPQSWNLLN